MLGRTLEDVGFVTGDSDARAVDRYSASVRMLAI
jgi:hypothetical protein